MHFVVLNCCNNGAVNTLASFEYFIQMQKSEEAQKHMKKAALIAKEYKPVTNDDIWTHSNESSFA